MPWSQWPQGACAGLRRVSDHRGAVLRGRRCPRHASIALQTRPGLGPRRQRHPFLSPLRDNCPASPSRPLPAERLRPAQPRQLHPSEIPGQQVCLQQLQLGRQLRPGAALAAPPTTCFQEENPTEPDAEGSRGGERPAAGQRPALQPPGRAGGSALSVSSHLSRCM